MSAETEVLEAAAALVADFGGGRVDPYFERLAPDATFVFYTAPAPLTSRQAYRELWSAWEAEDAFRVLGCRSSDQRVQVLAPDVAVLTHEVATRVATHAGEEDLRERETIVWAKRDGRWLVIHEHLSAAPAA